MPDIKRKHRHRQLALLGILLSCFETAAAGRLLDYIRNYDLNDYALGLSVSGSQNPYVDGEDSTIAYPVLTSFRDSAFTNDWLLLREGDVGIRWISPGDWELGFVGRIQTLGFGTTESPRLIGLDDRKWGLEMGPIAGYRGWPVHINFKTYAEVLGRHDGWISHLALTLPHEGERGYLVPGVELIHQDAAYANYYFGVAPSEANRFRPEYQTGSSTSTAVNIRWGYALTDKWLLYGDAGIEFLDSSITASPIVDRDQLFSARISIAYNNNIFQSRVSQVPPPAQPRFEFRVGAMFDNINSTIVRDSPSGAAGADIDLESLLGLSDEETVLHVDSIYRIGHYHRLEFGYLGISRDGQNTLSETIEYGDQIFPAGSVVRTSSETTIYRFGYAYSLINDSQKELGIMGGLHLTELATEITAAMTGQIETSNVSTPLPVIGLHGTISLGRSAVLGARIQFFRMDFHRYEGSLNFARLDWQRRVGDSFRFGIGYNYYGLNLDSRDNDLRGSFEIIHHGPEVFLNMAF